MSNETLHDVGWLVMACLSDPVCIWLFFDFLFGAIFLKQSMRKNKRHRNSKKKKEKQTKNTSIASCTVVCPLRNKSFDELI